MVLSRLLNKARSGAATAQPEYRILMVCLGNICRSPTAEAVMRHRLAQAGLGDRVSVDSAGTHAYHVGSPPDHRSQKHAKQRGYELEALRARKVDERDFAQFDLVLAMDWDNLSKLQSTCADPAHHCKVRRLMEFVPPGHRHAGQETVPDPYYGGPAGFEAVLDLVEAACDGLVEYVRSELERRAAAPPVPTGTP